MYDDCIKLMSAANTTDEYGDTTQAVEGREVFAKVKSVGMKEKYEALAIGLKPELVFVLADYYEYEDEPFVEYNSKLYKVFRTYRAGTTIELVVTESNADTKERDQS